MQRDPHQHRRAGRGAAGAAGARFSGSPGSRGGTRSTRLLPPASVLSPPICAATARVTRRRRSTNTRSCISSATWSASLMRWVRRPPSSSGMTGAPASPGRQRSCGPTASGRSAALSVPFRPRGKAPPTSLMPRTENAQFYQLYFQEQGAAEAELGRDPRATIRNMLFGASGDGVAAARAAAAAGGPALSLGMVPKGGGFLQGPGAPKTLPSWLERKRHRLLRRASFGAAASAARSTTTVTSIATGKSRARWPACR